MAEKVSKKKKSHDDGAAPVTPSLELLRDNLVGQAQDLYENAIERAFELKRDFLVFELAEKMRAHVRMQPAKARKEEQSGEWIGIESLSRLRNLVGGRFQNLKQRWICAGFPLREHRGDREKDYHLDENGWIELSNWILKQGYEARLVNENSAFLFELRATGK